MAIYLLICALIVINMATNINSFTDENMSTNIKSFTGENITLIAVEQDPLKDNRKDIFGPEEFFELDLDNDEDETVFTLDPEEDAFTDVTSKKDDDVDDDNKFATNSTGFPIDFSETSDEDDDSKETSNFVPKKDSKYNSNNPFKDLTVLMPNALKFLANILKDLMVHKPTNDYVQHKLEKPSNE